MQRPKNGWKIKEHSFSILQIFFKDTGSKFFYSLDWSSPLSRQRDRAIGLKRLTNLVTRAGQNAGIALIYDLASNELIAKYYEGIELSIKQENVSDESSPMQQTKWSEVSKLVSNLFKLIKSVRYYIVGTADALEDAQQVLEQGSEEKHALLQAHLLQLKERHEELVLVIENLQQVEKERKPLEKLFTELSA